MEFEDKFVIDEAVVLFDGMLSDAEVSSRISALLKSMASEPVALPAVLPQRDAHIRLSSSAVSGPITIANLKPVLRAMPQHRVRPDLLTNMPASKIGALSKPVYIGHPAHAAL